jgi:UDP-2,3-diacylglucosamine pyrophosphatase LpxH
MDGMPSPRPTLRFRSIFISDVHLGFKGCRAEFLLDFLRRVECQQIYLVGDIIEVWSLTRSFYWPQAHNDVIRTLLGKAKHGTRVVYVPGNHDRPFRDHDGLVLGNVEIRLEAVHETADGRRFLVLHGDEFDSIVRASPLLESLGSQAYAAVLRLNRYVNAVRRQFGFPYWSVAAFLKHKVKNAVKYIANFERAIAVEARRRGVQGVICGHIHRAEITEITEIDGITYCNDGDWVESCTALVEDFQGRLSLLRWTETVEVLLGSQALPLLDGAVALDPAA